MQYPAVFGSACDISLKIGFILFIFCFISQICVSLCVDDFPILKNNRNVVTFFQENLLLLVGYMTLY